MSYTVYKGYLDEPYLDTAYLGGTDLYSYPLQFNSFVDGYEKHLAVQFEGTPGYIGQLGFEFRSDKSVFHQVNNYYYGYLNGAYLSSAYLAGAYDVSFGVQFQGITTQKANLATQFEGFINATHTLPVQFLGQIDATHTLPIQFNSISVRPYGIQFFGVLYNTDNLRILANFASRGLTGQNWEASNTRPGHFNINNVNTDIVEEIWRTEDGVKNAILTCDTELPQGIYLDTLAFLNHNLTTSAIVELVGSNDPTFVDAGFSTPLYIGNDLNYYYIAPEYPAQSFRYWRINITDNSNPYGFLAIGTIVFGNSIIFLGECFVDEVDFSLQDFTDTVKTAGFTNVSNSRAIKKKLGLEFRFLNYQKVNFAAMRALFFQKRTVLKCLWIPTPSPFDQDLNARFGIFGKLVSIPTERHKSMGPTADYVSFTIEVDESL